MRDAEYYRERRKAIKAGTWTDSRRRPKSDIANIPARSESQTDNAITLRAWRAAKKHAVASVKLTAAEHQRAYRERQKAKATQSTDNRSPERIISDAALEAAIMQRGRQLRAMMRTPFCMWPSDWLSND